MKNFSPSSKILTLHLLKSLKNTMYLLVHIIIYCFMQSKLKYLIKYMRYAIIVLIKGFSYLCHHKCHHRMHTRQSARRCVQTRVSVGVL